jgi:hypothetical protein
MERDEGEAVEREGENCGKLEKRAEVICRYLKVRSCTIIGNKEETKKKKKKMKTRTKKNFLRGFNLD